MSVYFITFNTSGFCISLGRFQLITSKVTQRYLYATSLCVFMKRCVSWSSYAATEDDLNGVGM